MTLTQLKEQTRSLSALQSDISRKVMRICRFYSVNKKDFIYTVLESFIKEYNIDEEEYKQIKKEKRAQKNYYYPYTEYFFDLGVLESYLEYIKENFEEVFRNDELLN